MGNLPFLRPTALESERGGVYWENRGESNWGTGRGDERLRGHAGIPEVPTHEFLQLLLTAG